jgi:hemoglobin/transferrin/lactoferrin receptor protein
MQKISFKQSDKLIHNLNIQFSNSSDIPRYDRLTDPAGNGLKQAEWYYGPQKRILGIYSFKYKNEIGFFQQISTNINFQDILESRHTRRFNKNGIQNRNEHVNVYGFNIDAIKNIKKHLLHFGIDGQYNTLISKANEENIVTGEINKIDTRYPDGNNNMANISAYLLHNYKINDYLCLMEGIRAGYTVLNSSFKDTSFFKFPVNSISQKTPVYSGSFGIINNPSDELKLSAGIATGYRVPNIDDLSKVFESVPGRVILPNSNIKPEKTITYDLSVTNFIKTSTQIENTFYYTDFFDAITTQAFQYNGVDSILYMGTKSKVYANQNNRRAYIYGYSNSLKSTLTRHLNINFSFNYTYGRIKTDSSDYPLDHIPPVISRLSLNYINKGFQGFFFLNYNGWKRLKDYYIGGEDNENYATPLGMPGWITLNLRTSYSFKKFIILNTGIENILDTQYRVFASGINGGGRNLYASIQIKF